MNLIFLRFFILLMLYALSDGMMVKLKSRKSGDSKTSSTLRWIRSDAGRPLPRHSVAVNANNTEYVWCRGKFNSVQVPGGVVANGTCAFAFYTPSIVYANSYDVLVSIYGSARTKLVAWDSLMAKPKSGLLSPHRMLIAVPDMDNSPYYVAGNVGPHDSDRKALYSSDDSINKSESGFILVEDEPVEYRLTNIRFITKYETYDTSKYELNSTQLINLGQSKKLVDGIVSYTIPNIQYWGKPKGTMAGLVGTIYTENEDPVEIDWGIESTLKRVVFSSINYELPPLSSVNATVVGTMETYEAPYEGVLTTIFEDGFSPNRRISSLHTRKIFKKVEVTFSSPFYLNGSIVDEPERTKLVYERTTTTTTTPPPSTSTVTTSTTKTIETTENNPVLLTGIFSSPSSVPKNPHLYVLAPKQEETVYDNLHPTSQTHLSVDRHELRNDEDNFDGHEKDIVGNEELKSTSDRIISLLSTIFTGLVIWYFSLGIVA